MSIALAVVEHVEQEARRAGAVAVDEVRLEVGELAGVVGDALVFAFEVARAGTLLDGADLVVEPVTARARCGPCDREWAVGLPPDLLCPQCAGGGARLLSGRELRVTGVRWADASRPAATTAKG